MVSMLYNVICSRTFYFILSSLVTNIVTTPSDCDRSLLILTLTVLKIKK